MRAGQEVPASRDQSIEPTWARHRPHLPRVGPAPQGCHKWEWRLLVALRGRDRAEEEALRVQETDVGTRV